MKNKFLFLFLFIFCSSQSYATSIRVIDFQKIIELNENLTLLYNLIEADQKLHKQKFEKEELTLQNEFKRIEKLNLILDPTELEKEVENYNNKLNSFNDKIQKFNLHYETQINNLKNTIINTTLDVLKEYSENNKIDLVLDSQNYILSSNSINITDLIEDQVSLKKIEINFENY